MGSVRSWHVKDEKDLLHTRVFSVREQWAASTSQPDLQGRFVIIDAPDWVNVIAETSTGEVVMVEQYRHGCGCTTIEIPGGMVDPGEDVVTAARRELREETGYDGEEALLIGVVRPNPAIQSNRCWTVWIRDVRWVAEPDPDPHEELDVSLMSRGEVRAAIRTGRIDHALVLAAWHHLSLREGS